ncbi:hypothetical protein PS938_00603 [Pseudomonas fluorescens]|uniref:Uncharacterized protein n=1 Tax=Pseudomonas fluorescens TaxID=294 RepID=A0A5E7SAC4_PSEFL|nr:glycosyl transferase [Pseudomonas fluorescens]VVP80163.1 hypothetical protein PS938_00603 [Pseudomonas fluorescens]
MTVLLSVVGLTALTAFTRKNPIILGFGLVACLSIACGQAWPLIVVAAFSLSSTVLGRWILGQRVSAGWSVHFLLGAGTLGTLTGLAAHFPINYPWLYSALLLLPLLFGHTYTMAFFRELLILIRSTRDSACVTQTVLDVLISGFACLYILIAFMPEGGYDALAMHLFVPSHLAQMHQWKFDASTYVWAVMPMLVDWIYSFVYMLGGETASRLINSAFALLLAWQVREMTIWAGGSATSSRWAALIFLSTPLAFAESNSLYIESAWTAFIMGGTLAILKVSSFTPDAKERLSHLLLAGAMLGFAMAAKAVTLSILPVLLVMLLLQYKAWATQGIVQTLILGSVCLVLAGVTPYVTAWCLTGNPVFPFFNAIFQSPLWPSKNFEPPEVYGKGVTWDTLYRMVFNSSQFIEGGVGAAGFQWLLLPTAAVTLFLSGNKKALFIFLISAGAMIMTFHSTAYLRYILPSFALFSVVLALPFSETKVFPRTAGIIAGILLILTNTRFIDAGAYLGQIKPSALFSTAGRDAYLTQRMPIRKMVDIVNALNTDNHPVAVFAHPLMAGLNSEALYQSWYNVKWQSEFNAASSQPELVQLLRYRHVEWLIIDPAHLHEPQLSMLLSVSTSYAKVANVDLRKLNDIYYERLLNPDLSSLGGWNLTSPSTYDAPRKILTVNVKTPATQQVEVTPYQPYKSSVTARCATASTVGRIQTNWIDATGAFITASIETFNCTAEWATHEMTVVAPLNASAAIVYVAGHTDTPLEFKSLSFRQ